MNETPDQPDLRPTTSVPSVPSAPAVRVSSAADRPLRLTASDLMATEVSRPDRGLTAHRG